jgi:uncharacterized damage-inducible protein DinB
MMEKKYLLAQFDFHHKLYNNVLEGFTDEETNQRLHDDTNMNHAKYIAGHLLNVQYAFALLAGVEVEHKWDDLFAGLGQSKARHNISYPSIETIKAEWNGIYDKTRKGLENLSEEELNQKPPKPLDKVFEDNAIFDNTVAGFLTFLNHHQAYHIGQIGILRRGFGKEPMHYD